MTKKMKILLILLIAVFILLAYLIATSKRVAKIEEGTRGGGKNANIDLVILENEYKVKAKEILSAYLNLIQGGNFTAAQITKLKNDLLNLKVPAKFKDLHLDLVLAMVKMENFLQSNNEEDKVASQRMISQIKANYAWLN